MAEITPTTQPAAQRLLSLDFLRGFIMVLLAMDLPVCMIIYMIIQKDRHLMYSSGNLFITHGMAYISGIWYNPHLCSWPVQQWLFHYISNGQKELPGINHLEKY